MAGGRRAWGIGKPPETTHSSRHPLEYLAWSLLFLLLMPLFAAALTGEETLDRVPGGLVAVVLIYFGVMSVAAGHRKGDRVIQRHAALCLAGSFLGVPYMLAWDLGNGVVLSYAAGWVSLCIGARAAVAGARRGPLATRTEPEQVA